MKIGFFTDAYYPQINGVATSIDAWAKALEKRGHQVYIIAPKYPNYKDDSKNIIRLSSVKVKDKPEIRLATFLPEIQLLKLAQMDFDVIEGFSGGSITSLGMIVAKLKNIPYIMTYNTRWSEYTHYFLKGKVVKPGMLEKVSRVYGNRCDFVVAPTPKIKEELAGFGVSTPISVIPSGIDLSVYGKQQKGFLRERIGLKDERILLYVGRLAEEKSIDFLIRAFKEVSKSVEDVVLVLVGDGPERNKLEKLVSKLNLQRKVIFTGFIPQQQIPKVYPDAQVFVFASQTETQGLVILEAMASRVPVVAVTDRVFEDFIQSGKNGILVNSDHQKFAVELINLLKNPSTLQELAKNAFETSQKHSLEYTAQTLEKLYKSLYKEKKKMRILPNFFKL